MPNSVVVPLALRRALCSVVAASCAGVLGACLPDPGDVVSDALQECTSDDDCPAGEYCENATVGTCRPLPDAGPSPEPEPFALASGLSNAHRWAMSPGRDALVWFDGLGFWTVPATGGAPEALDIETDSLSVTGIPGSLAADDDGLYWLTFDGVSEVRVFRADLDGGAPVQLAAQPIPTPISGLSIGRLHLDGGYAYWVISPDGVTSEVARVSTEGGDVRTLSWAPEWVPPGYVAECPSSCITTLGEDVYFLARGAHGREDGTLLRAPLDLEGEVEVAWSPLASPDGIAAANGRVYWTEWGQQNSALTYVLGSVRSYLPCGPDDVTEAGNCPHQADTLATVFKPWAIAVDGVNVYWVSDQGVDQKPLMVLAHGTTLAKELVPDVASETRLEHNNTHVFWVADDDTDSVWTMPKPF